MDEHERNALNFDYCKTYEQAAKRAAAVVRRQSEQADTEPRQAEALREIASNIDEAARRIEREGAEAKRQAKAEYAEITAAAENIESLQAAAFLIIKSWLRHGANQYQITAGLEEIAKAESRLRLEAAKGGLMARLWEAKERQGLSMRELSERLKISRSALEQWKSGGRKAGTKSRRKIKAYLEAEEKGDGSHEGI